MCGSDCRGGKCGGSRVRGLGFIGGQGGTPTPQRNLEPESAEARAEVAANRKPLERLVLDADGDDKGVSLFCGLVDPALAGPLHIEQGLNGGLRIGLRCHELVEHFIEHRASFA